MPTDPTNNKRPPASKQPRSSWREGITPPPRQSDEPDAHVGTRWRELRQEYDAEASLPPLPDQGKQKQRRSSGGSNKAVIFGALLLIAVVALAILPFSSLLNGDDPKPSPTADVAQVTEPVIDNGSGTETPVPTNVPAETVDSDFLVCIDPGHGGWDFGRQRLDMNEFPPPWIHESEITLSMAFFLRDELESRGIAVVMTRETGGAVNWRNEDVNGDGRVKTDSAQGKIDGDRDELQARINICNAANADIMVSIHINGTDDQTIGGYEIFWNNARPFSQLNLDLATFLLREMSLAFADQGYDAYSRGTTDDMDLHNDSNVYGSEQFLILIGPEVVKPEYTIVPSAMPGVIIEALFVTNTDDANFILNPANQKRLAVGWANAIENYRAQHGDGE
ncbi:MAG: N-acetylmuramoyl-L-alanine amidase [Thermomicrobiales bacterium]|nr:N-acetylmuramoyl-L-alanine amidase [Thermomicrobiales bacterium]